MRLALTIIHILLINISLPLLGNSTGLSLQKEFEFADSLYSIQPDSSFIYYKQLEDKCYEINDTIRQIKCLQRMGFICYQQTRLAEALNYQTEALQLSKHIKSKTNTAKCLTNLSDVYLKLGHIKEGESYIRKAHSIYLDCFKEKEISQKTLLHSFINLAELAKKKKQFQTALAYIDTCLTITQANNYTYTVTANINRIKANTLSAIDKLDEALEILLPMDTYYNTISDTDSNQTYHFSNAILVSGQIGEIYSKQEKYNLGLKYLFKSLDLIDHLDKKMDYRLFVLNEITNIYKKQNQYNKAYKYRTEAYFYVHKNLKVSSNRSKEVLKVRNSYIEKIEAKDKELLASKLMLANKDKANLRLRVILLIGLVLTITTALLLWNKIIKRRLKNEKRLIQEKATEQDQVAQMELKYKNRELTSYSLQLIERDDLLDQLIEHIDKDKSRKAKSLKFARKRLDSDLWEEFEKRFVNIHQGFYERLTNKYPVLTTNDLKFCALVKLNLKGKEIARLLGMTEKSVHSARYRIRKKLELPSNDSLEEFLNEV